MAKEKSFKSESKHLKRKKMHSAGSEAHVDETTGSTEKKKLKRVQVEEAPVQISHVTTAAKEEKQKKEKKRKKKQRTEQTQEINKISEPPSLPEGEHETKGEEDLSPEEQRVLERKMKKILKKEEKKRLKAEAETSEKTNTSGPTASQQALDYLTCWADNRTQWKFQKTRQTWLLQHMFDPEMIPDDKFSMLLQYSEGLRGGARDTTVQKALVLVQESGKAQEDEVVQQRVQRAREVIQLLS